MDEPFSALDAQTREIMQTELLRIWEQGRKTVLFVTHQIDEAVFLSDRVLVLTARPARLKADIAMPNAERGGDYRKSADYLRLRAQIWDLLREEVLKTRALEEGA